MVLSGLVLSDWCYQSTQQVLHKRHSLPCLCTLNQTPLWDVRLETRALPRAEFVLSVSHTDQCLPIIPCSNMYHFPCQGPRPVVQGWLSYSPLFRIQTAIWMNCSFVLALELPVTVFSVEMSAELSPATSPSPWANLGCSSHLSSSCLCCCCLFFQCKKE